ncbi:MAG TPA: amidohydrolase family protein [Ktedonobacteraceae bacterium]|nr:amidohydrolase family protein [Ktedonobacteraceae bacterium]
MLDLTGIPVIDNHCHPVLLNQQMDALQFRSNFTEATDASFPEKHVRTNIYYTWFLRQTAKFYGCSAREEEILAVRNSMDADVLLESLLGASHIDTLILDTGYPLSDQCYTPERMGELGHCQAAKLLRLETLVQQLVLAHDDFDDLLERYSTGLSNIRERGYCAFKSIVAYRTGLNVERWGKDEAARSFAEAHTMAIRSGRLRIAHKPLLDYLLHIAFRKAAEQQLPVQFHTGYGDSDTDMRLGNPLHLRDVLEQPEYRSMPVVLLHESYPYCQLGAYLAAIYPHVYFDLSYTIPFVDKLEMLAFTRQALGVAPVSKLMFSTDGINVPEMHWVGAMRGRNIIGQVLNEMIAADEIDEGEAYSAAQAILLFTARDVYQLKAP